jgi:hypothetical protein
MRATGDGRSNASWLSNNYPDSFVNIVRHQHVDRALLRLEQFCTAAKILVMDSAARLGVLAAYPIPAA